MGAGTVVVVAAWVWDAASTRSYREGGGGCLTRDLKDGLGAVAVGDVQRVRGIVHNDAAVLARVRHQLLKRHVNEAHVHNRRRTEARIGLNTMWSRYQVDESRHT